MFSKCLGQSRKGNEFLLPKLMLGELEISDFKIMILDKQLVRNYNELSVLILYCYKDISILKGYEELQNKKKDLYEMVSNISNHFILLVQKDLALTLWKIYYDTDPNANTVSKFRNTVNKLLRDSGCECKQVKQEKINKSIETTLKELRRQFLAHVDMKRSNNRIKICELKELLDVICKEFNRVCDAIDDDRIIKISEIDIEWQDMSCVTELLALYSQE